MTDDLPKLPDGWELQEGAGGWRCINRTRLWETNVYYDDSSKGPGQARAILAAVKLQNEAEKTLHNLQRLCRDLREYFMEDAHAPAA